MVARSTPRRLASARTAGAARTRSRGARDVAAGNGGLDQLFIARRHVADDRAGVAGGCAVRISAQPRAAVQLELDERRAGRDDIARLPCRACDAHRSKGEGTSTTALAVSTATIGWSTLTRVADFDVPANDLGFRQALAEIGKIERSHATPPRS